MNRLREFGDSDKGGFQDQGIPTRRCRSVFISDIHLGSVSCKAEEVYAFLQSIECEKMYLVGDIVDVWVGSREIKWTQMHNNVLRHLLGRGKDGCQVFYTPGNHDAFMRVMNGAEMGEILIDHSFTHRTMEGKNLLVVHGDLYDKTVTKYQKVAYVGAWGHEMIGQINAKVNVRRSRKEKGPVDFANAMKRGMKRWVRRKTGYEEMLISDAREEGFDGVVCGHTHKPTVTHLPDGMMYINTGDWTDNCTAVVEDFNGRLHMIFWRDEIAKRASALEVERRS